MKMKNLKDVHDYIQIEAKRYTALHHKDSAIVVAKPTYSMPIFDLCKEIQSNSHVSPDA